MKWLLEESYGCRNICQFWQTCSWNILCRYLLCFFIRIYSNDTWVSHIFHGITGVCLLIFVSFVNKFLQTIVFLKIDTSHSQFYSRRSIFNKTSICIRYINSRNLIFLISIALYTVVFYTGNPFIMHLLSSTITKFHQEQQILKIYILYLLIVDLRILHNV